MRATEETDAMISIIEQFSGCEVRLERNGERIQAIASKPGRPELTKFIHSDVTPTGALAGLATCCGIVDLKEELEMVADGYKPVGTFTAIAPPRGPDDPKLEFSLDVSRGEVCILGPQEPNIDAMIVRERKSREVLAIHADLDTAKMQALTALTMKHGGRHFQIPKP